MSKNLIIFGAGASIGSEENNMPPLGNRLFDELVTFSPNGWGNIPEDLAKIFQNDFEKGMEELSVKYPDSMTQIQSVMAKFFFRYRPTTSSLYVKMAEKIKENQWDGSLSTLNYERLLELSLRHAGLMPKFQSSGFPEIEMCYPHGCCNFFCEGLTGTGNLRIGRNGVSFGPGGSLNFGQGGSLNFSSGGITTGGTSLKIINDQFLFNQKIGEAFPPVMSYFITSKFTTSCANFIQNERDRFNKLVADADNIAIIGIMVREHDGHIWDSLASTSAAITYCAGSSGKQYSEWAKENRTDFKKDSVLDGYWDENFDEICTNVDL